MLCLDYCLTRATSSRIWIIWCWDIHTWRWWPWLLVCTVHHCSIHAAFVFKRFRVSDVNQWTNYVVVVLIARCFWFLWLDHVTHVFIFLSFTDVAVVHGSSMMSLPSSSSLVRQRFCHLWIAYNHCHRCLLRLPSFVNAPSIRLTRHYRRCILFVLPCVSLLFLKLTRQ